MEGNASEREQNKINEISIEPDTWLTASERLNRKYPYLTAFIGFIALYALSGLVAGFIVAVPAYILSIIMDVTSSDKYQSVTTILKLILQLLISFHGFKFVINKNVLPYTRN